MIITRKGVAVMADYGNHQWYLDQDKCPFCWRGKMIIGPYTHYCDQKDCSFFVPKEKE